MLPPYLFVVHRPHILSQNYLLGCGLVYGVHYKEEKIGKSVVVFIQVEKEDEERKDKIKKKTFENIKWLAKKVNVEEIMLHSFGHLSESKSSPKFAQEIIGEIKKSLEERGFKTNVTPFGYFLEFKIHVLGESLAKVFKSL